MARDSYEEEEEDDEAEYGYDAAARGPSTSKMRGHGQQRQEARDQLVATIRRYGMYAVAALILLPLQVVGILALGAGIVYMLMKRVWRSGPMMAE